MGSVFCVAAARDRNLPSGTGSGAINRRRVADEIEDSPFHHNSYVGNRGISIEKRGPPSESGSFPGHLDTSAFQKSLNSESGTADDSASFNGHKFDDSVSFRQKPSRGYTRLAFTLTREETNVDGS